MRCDVSIGSRKGQHASFAEQPSQPTQHSVPDVKNRRNKSEMLSRILQLAHGRETTPHVEEVGRKEKERAVR